MPFAGPRAHVGAGESERTLRCRGDGAPALPGWIRRGLPVPGWHAGGESRTPFRGGRDDTAMPSVAGDTCSLLLAVPGHVGDPRAGDGSRVAGEGHGPDHGGADCR